jgi:hypothetical protein
MSTNDSITPAFRRRMRAAQDERILLFQGTVYTRVPYTHETIWGDAFQQRTEPCCDCAVAPGELHVPTCCMEECPVCHDEQRISCEHWWTVADSQ